MSLNEILREAVQREASDVLLIAGLPVSYKVNGHICREGERLFPASGSTPSASAAPWPWSSGWCPFPSRTGGRWASLKT